ncbi:MAG TPA: O-antigen ligase family protein [Candidatus Dojkabacteria bacterium]|nr:O-antigen ligase family protein [Candidatus Dojkabacteria bacterium]
MLLIIIFFLLSFPRLGAFYDYVLTNLGINLDERIVSKLSILVVTFIIILWTTFNYKHFLKDLKKWIKETDNKYFIAAVVIFLVTVLLSASFGIAFKTSLITLVYWVLIFASYLFLSVIWKKALSLKLIALSLYLTFMVSMIQMLSYHFNWNWEMISSLFNTRGMVDLSGFTLKEGSTWILRPSGFMNDPNFLSIFLSISLVYLFKEFENIIEPIKEWGEFIKKVKSEMFYILAFILGFINLMLTASRTGILIFVVGICTYLVFKVVFKLNRKFVFSGFFVQLFDRFKFNDISFFEHLKYAQVALQIFIEKPLLGIGAGNYPLYYKLYIDKRVDFGTPHTTYLKILAETGLLGIISFVIPIGMIVYRLLRSRYLVGISVISVILSSAIAYDSLLTPWVWMFIAMIVSDIV